jgi:hypothetical protein
MTPRHVAVSFVLFVGLLFNLYGQQFTFQNLDFEATPIYAGSNSFGSVYTIPNWQVLLNNIPQSGVGNGYSLDATATALVVGSSAIDGNQSIYLSASGYEATLYGSSTASIYQAGNLPRSAHLIEFKLRLVAGTGEGMNPNLPQTNVFLIVNNQVVPLAVLATTDSFFILGADVTRWAGQPVQLMIGVMVPYNSAAPGISFVGIIDDVAFVSGLPNLSIGNSTNGIVVSWPNTGNYVLQQINDIASAAGWTASAHPIATNADNTIGITVPAQRTGNLFFRLVTP